METGAIVKKIIQEMVIPEFGIIKQENGEIKRILELTNKRLDDTNRHLIEQSRRIDEINNRIDETNRRIDRLYEVIVRREEHVNLEQRCIILEERLEQVCGQITSFPSILKLNDQGMFALGYYHQEADTRKEIANRSKDKEDK